MHELSLCRSIAAIAERNRGGRRVVRVGIQIGAFRQAVPETLTYCWQIVTEGTALAGSRLDFEVVPLEIECGACGARSVLERMWLRCPSCEATNIVIVHGEEFLVTTMDLADQERGRGGDRADGFEPAPRQGAHDGQIPPSR